MEKFDIQFTDHVEKEKDLEFKKRMAAVVDSCVESISKEHVALGEGKAAEVYSRTPESISCVKFNLSSGISFNNIDMELEILDTLYEAGISVPEPIGIARGEFDMLIMEKMEASSLEDYIKGVNRFELPKDFDVDVFFDKCTAEMQKMHDAGVYHRDLHLGNILISKEGNPIFIDFGDSKKKYLSDEDVYKGDSINGFIRYIPDEDSLKSSKKDFKKYLEEGAIIAKQQPREIIEKIKQAVRRGNTLVADVEMSVAWAAARDKAVELLLDKEGEKINFTGAHGSYFVTREKPSNIETVVDEILDKSGVIYVVIESLN